MAFFGGNTTNLGATSTPSKPSGLFSSFSAGTVGPTSTFGSTPLQPAIATTGFGAATPSFNTTNFGAANATNTSATGGQLPTLGGFAGFGATTATSTAPTLFGGATPATSTAAPATFGGFGTGSALATGFGGFGMTAPAATAPGFGGFGATTTSAFGSGANFGTGTGFGVNTFNKGAMTTVTPGFGGFGGNTNFMMGQPQQVAPQISADEAFAQSILNVAIFGDERDNIIAKWNYLQAMWGTGKLFYSQSAAPVDITQENYLCRFKAMGYSRMPGMDNKMGLVTLSFNKTLAEVKPQQPQIVQTLHTIFGSKPNLMVLVDDCKELEDKKCQMIIYIEEKSQLTPNESKRILATDVANYLAQPNVKGHLNNLAITSTFALVQPDEDQLKEYFKTPPKGVDPRMWRQAKLDNPEPTQFIPVPMIGSKDLKWRVKHQEQEAETHALYLRKVEKDLIELRQRHAAATAKILEYKRNLAELGHSVLKIIVKQECTRKVGLALSPEEETLRTKLENMHAVLSAPTQFKGRLSELLSQMRMQRNQFALNGGTTEYTIDKDSQTDMIAFFSMQQKAMEALTDTVTKDLKALDIIIQGMPELMKHT